MEARKRKADFGAEDTQQNVASGESYGSEEGFSGSEWVSERVSKRVSEWVSELISIFVWVSVCLTAQVSGRGVNVLLKPELYYDGATRRNFGQRSDKRGVSHAYPSAARSILI